MITADILNLSAGGLVIPVINKSDEIKNYLISVGVDHSKINTIHTPFIGACEYAELNVLLASPDITTVDLPAPNSEFRGLYAFRVYEENGGGSGGGKGDGSDGKTSGPIIGNGQQLPPSINDEMGNGEIGRGSVPMFTNITQAQLQTIQTYGRTLIWHNLVCISRYELLISAGSQNAKISTEVPSIVTTTKPSIWLYTFVDQRYFLRDLLPLSTRGISTTASTFFHSKINVVAENPIHLIPETCKSTTALYGTFGETDPRTEPLFVNTMGFPYRNTWYAQTSWSANEVFDNFIGILSNNLKSNFGTENIVFSYKSMLNSVIKNKYDFIDLDFSGLTLGQAMDLLASRIGCVWAWDRRQSKLYLRTTSAIGDYNANNVNSWNFFNSEYRSSGGLSSITQEAPSAVYTIHKIKEVNLYGLDTDKVCQTYKKSEYTNGVEYNSLGSFYLATRVRTAGDSRRVVCINDHLPAFVGNCVYTNSGFVTATNVLPSKTSIPWNYNNTNLGLYRTKDYATSLTDRNTVLNQRYLNAKDNMGGDVTLSRIPVSSFNSSMDITPSVSLSCDFVDFNNVDDRQIFYRLYGGYEKDLIYPYLKNTSPVVARGISQATNQSGIIGIEVQNAAPSIVRSFPCLLFGGQAICYDGTHNEPMAWKYQFTEIYPKDDKVASWAQGNYNGNQQFAQGFCLNMPESLFLATSASGPPTYNSDGTRLNYETNGQPKVRLQPIPYGTYCICHEVVGRKGLTSFFIDKTNGLRVDCVPTASPIMPSPNWAKDNISGVGFTDSKDLASQVIQ